MLGAALVALAGATLAQPADVSMPAGSFPLLYGPASSSGVATVTAG